MRYFIVGVVAGSEPFISSATMMALEFPTFPTYEELKKRVDSEMRSGQPRLADVSKLYYIICSITEVSGEDLNTFTGVKLFKPEEKTYTAQEVRELMWAQKKSCDGAVIAKDPDGLIRSAIIDAPVPPL